MTEDWDITQYPIDGTNQSHPYCLHIVWIWACQRKSPMMRRWGCNFRSGATPNRLSSSARGKQLYRLTPSVPSACQEEAGLKLTHILSLCCIKMRGLMARQKKNWADVEILQMCKNEALLQHCASPIVNLSLEEGRLWVFFCAIRVQKNEKLLSCTHFLNLLR